MLGVRCVYAQVVHATPYTKFKLLKIKFMQSLTVHIHTYTFI